MIEDEYLIRHKHSKRKKEESSFGGNKDSR